MKKLLTMLFIFSIFINTNFINTNFLAQSNIPQLEDGVLNVGTECSYAPYEFTTTEDNASDSAQPLAGSKGYCDGYDMMIAKSLADGLGVDLEVTSLAFDALIPALNSEQIDVVIAGMSSTEERQKEIDFTDNYYNTNLVMSIVMNKDNKYANAKTLEDFESAEISSQLGTFHGDILPQIPNITIATPMDSVDGLIQATKSNTIDGYITEHEAAVSQTEGSDDLIYVDLPTGENGINLDDSFTGVAIGAKKGSDELIAQMNDILANISDEQREAFMTDASAKADIVANITEESFLMETWHLFLNNKDLYLNGIITTLYLAIVGTLLGTLLGIILVIMRIQKVHYKDFFFIKILKKTLNVLAIIYIDLIRGTPMMVQAMLFYYGLAANIMEPNMAGAIIISLNTGAYIAEILRSGVNSLDKGQMEAGRSLGLTNIQTFISVIIPQTLKNTLPALANQLIVNIKDSSVLSVIAVSELFFATKQAASAGYMYTQAYLIAAIIYLILTIILTKLLSSILGKWLNDGNTQDIMTLQNIEEEIK